ncbi:hypothetical protein M3Y98_00405600 [Aphelenchoides besseyi]|nr:hypothetical protein M3Y98_00405600 [Aphelenchoides besseyi]
MSGWKPHKRESGSNRDCNPPSLGDSYLKSSRAAQVALTKEKTMIRADLEFCYNRCDNKHSCGPKNPIRKAKKRTWYAKDKATCEGQVIGATGRALSAKCPCTHPKDQIKQIMTSRLQSVRPSKLCEFKRSMIPKSRSLFDQCVGFL